MTNRLSIKIGSIEAQGISPDQVLGGLAALKTDLEALGCEVSITVAGQDVTAINVLTLADCPHCGGTGQVGMFRPALCRHCDGSGVRGEWK